MLAAAHEPARNWLYVHSEPGPAPPSRHNTTPGSKHAFLGGVHDPAARFKQRLRLRTCGDGNSPREHLLASLLNLRGGGQTTAHQEHDNSLLKTNT